MPLVPTPRAGSPIRRWARRTQRSLDHLAVIRGDGQNILHEQGGAGVRLRFVGDWTLYTRFRAYRDAGNRAAVNVSTGTWTRNGSSVSASASAVGDADNPYIVASLDDPTAPTTLAISAAAAVPDPTDTEKRLLCALEHIGPASAKRVSKINVHHLGDIVDVRIAIVRRWYAYGATVPGVADTDYVEQDDEPTETIFRLHEGAFWLDLVDATTSPFQRVHQYTQRCVQMTY